MKYQKTLLKSGLQVISVPLQNRRSTSLGVWIRVGNRNEPARLNGISHFIEHLVFKGTKTRSMRQIKEAVEGKGGSLNAFTGSETTCLLARVPDPYIYPALEVLAEMATHARFEPTEIEKERSVIMEEIKMVLDNPGQQAEELLDEMFWKNHPLGRPIAGTAHSVSQIQQADIVNYYREYYSAPLLTVVAAGHIDHEELSSWCEKAFAGIATQAPKPPQALEPGHLKAGFKLHHKDIEQAHLALAVEGLPRRHADQYTLKLLSIILGGNMSSRLFNELREERGLAYEIASFSKSQRDTGAFMIEAGVDAAKTKDALKGIMRECVRLVGEPVSKGELERAKDFFTGQTVIGLENSMDVMLWIGEETVAFGDAVDIGEVERRVRAVTASDIQRLATQIFTDKTLNGVVVGPIAAREAAGFKSALTFKAA